MYPPGKARSPLPLRLRLLAAHLWPRWPTSPLTGAGAERCCVYMFTEYRLLSKKGEGTFSEVLKAQVRFWGGFLRRGILPFACARPPRVPPNVTLKYMQ